MICVSVRKYIFSFLKNFGLQFKKRFGLSQCRLLILHILREVVSLGKPSVTVIIEYSIEYNL